MAMEERVSSDLAAGIRAAVKHYRRRLESACQPLGLPPRLSSKPASHPATSIDVWLGTEAEEAVKLEAVRLHVTPQDVLSHAVLTYLADLDRADRPLPFIDPATV